MYTKALVRLEQVNVSLGTQQALRSVSTTFYTGEHCVLWGENGAGKSTLLRVLRGEQQVDQGGNGGTVAWYRDGIPSTALLDGRALSALVSPAQQESVTRQMWQISARELILAGLTDTDLLYTSPSETIQAYLEEKATQLGCIHLLHKEVPSLSQGQMRLVLTLRAIVRRPHLLLLDELVDGIDKGTRHILLDFLEDEARHCTLVLSSHRPTHIPHCVQRALYLEQGKILRDEPWKPVSCAPQSAHDLPVQPPKIVRMYTEPSPLHVPKKRNHPAAEHPLICLTSATVFVERTEVLHSIDWRLEKGQHWCIQGENGAGKSTFLRLLYGSEFPAAGGSIQHYLPRHGGLTHTREDLQRGIGFFSSLLQATYASTYSAAMNCEDLVCSGFDGTQGIYRQYTPEEQYAAQWIMDKLSILPLAKRAIETLSTGQKRRIFLARALVGAPDILLLDEPFAGLDEANRTAFTQLLEQCAEQETHLVLVTHHADERLPCIRHNAELKDGFLHIL